jgi:hypothetical protein
VLVETFIVRVWTPSQDLADEIAPGELRGNVEHVGSQQQAQFRTAGDLLEILRAVLEPAAEAGRLERFKQT